MTPNQQLSDAYGQFERAASQLGRAAHAISELYAVPKPQKAQNDQRLPAVRQPIRDYFKAHPNREVKAEVVANALGLDVGRVRSQLAKLAAPNHEIVRVRTGVYRA